MYWNERKWRMGWPLRRININMRCIEMSRHRQINSHQKGLTLTWDVLKFLHLGVVLILLFRLTLTWDVLKLSSTFPTFRLSFRLTLTWDVLKSPAIFPRRRNTAININMRCIEMGVNYNMATTLFLVERTVLVG